MEHFILKSGHNCEPRTRDAATMYSKVEGAENCKAGWLLQNIFFFFFQQILNKAKYKEIQ
jgi:hypothetical protein